MEFIDLKSQQARIRGEIDRRLAAVLEHGRYVLGPEVFELEERLADHAGVAHCVAVGSGTDSLLIALMALDIGPGDEVITVPYTWISTAEVIALAGAKPVFVDIEATTLNMDPACLEAAISERTRAIIPVGIYGQTADMQAINAIAARHGNIPVIEDAAQSYGATHHGRRSGALSEIGSTSFFPSKPLACYGEGGALFTDDADLAESFRQIRVHGQAGPNHHPRLGLNGRLETMQAAVLLAKLDIFDDEIERRQEVAQRYRDALAPSFRMTSIAPGNTSAYAHFTVLSEGRDQVLECLREADIPCVAYYSVPLHLQPVFADLGHRRGDFPVAERAAAECLSLPMGPYLSVEDQARVIEVLEHLPIAG